MGEDIEVSGCKREPPAPALKIVEEVGFSVVMGSFKGGSWPWRIIDEGRIGKPEMLNRSDSGYK